MALWIVVGLVVAGGITAFLNRLRKQAVLIEAYFLWACVTFFLYNDQAAAKAAVMAAHTATGLVRERMLALLLSLTDANDAVAMLIGAANRIGTPDRQWVSRGGCAVVRERAASLLKSALAETGRGLVAERDEFARASPAYERGLGGFANPDPTVFAALDRDAMKRLERFFLQ